MGINKSFKIDSFDFDVSNNVFIVAELSANHNGSLQNALDTIKAAKRAGADAIKLQTYTADTITIDCKTDDFKIKQGTIWDGKYLYDFTKKLILPGNGMKNYFRVAKGRRTYLF